MRPVDQMHRRLLHPPAGHVDKLEHVILVDELAFTGDFDIPGFIRVLGAAGASPPGLVLVLENLDCKELLEVCGGGGGGDFHILHVQVGQEGGVRARQDELNLKEKEQHSDIYWQSRMWLC